MFSLRGGRRVERIILYEKVSGLVTHKLWFSNRFVLKLWYGINYWDFVYLFVINLLFIDKIINDHKFFITCRHMSLHVVVWVVYFFLTGRIIGSEITLISITSIGFGTHWLLLPNTLYHRPQIDRSLNPMSPASPFRRHQFQTSQTIRSSPVRRFSDCSGSPAPGVSYTHRFLHRSMIYSSNHRRRSKFVILNLIDLLVWFWLIYY